MVRLILMAILLGLLTGCGTGGLEPSSQVVQRALVKFNEVIALHLSQTQLHPLSQQLDPSRSSKLPSFEINQLVITEQKPLVIQDLPAYRVRGTYDLTIQRQRRRVTQQQNPFEIYLQRQKEGLTWCLALPQSTGIDSFPTWRTYLIKSM